MDEQVQTYTFPDINTKVMMITGELMDIEEKIYMGATEEMVCGSKAQSTLFKDDSVIVTETRLKGGMVCKDYGLDEKDFWDFAYRR